MTRTQTSEPRTLIRGYHREPSVVADIGRLSRLGPRDFWLQVSLTDNNAPDTPRLEALVYLARDRMRCGAQEDAWRIADVLVRRVAATVGRTLVRLFAFSPQDRGDVEEELAVTFYEEWLSLDPAHEFWEARFMVCLKRKIIDAAKRKLRASEAEVHLMPPGDEPDSGMDPLEGIADDNAVDPYLATEAKLALTSLPKHEAEAVYLRYYEEWTEEAIGSHLGVTARSVRNYLTSAKKRLAAWST